MYSKTLTPRPLWAPALLACLAAPALAQTSDLRGSASTTGGPYMTDSHVSVPYATISGVHSQDTTGNKSKANGTLATPDGNFSFDAHACSGGGPNFGGQANGSANADITLDYQLVSPTLPVGTPVQVRVQWSTSANVMAVGQDMLGVNTGAQAGADGHVTIYINYQTVENRSGAYSARHNFVDGYNQGHSGALNPQGDTSDQTYTLLVGQAVRVFMSGSIGCASSVEAGQTDGDGQMAMVWGVSSLDSAASFVLLQSNPPEPAPPAEMATPAHAIELRPPRPNYPGILPCFRIPTQPTPVGACAGSPASLSVSPLGAGPFTYQWRKGGVPLNTIANPTAATATLTFSSVTVGDAGSYDCLITNPCGTIASGSATLTVSAGPTISRDPASTSTCGSNPASFSVGVDGPGPFTYQWQVQATQGIWQDVGSDPTALPCGGAAVATPDNSANVDIAITPCPGVTQYKIRCIVSSGGCGSTTSAEATLTINSADFNGDGDTGTDSDIESFFACLGGNCCPTCGSADFNGDGDLGTDRDIEGFFRVLGGGGC